MKNNLRRVLKTRLDNKQDKILAKPGIMGDGTGLLDVSGLDHYVYVRTSAGCEEVFNNRVPPENDLLVMVGYDPAQPDLYQVLSTRSAFPGGVTGGAVAGYAPAIRYQWMADGGGQDPLWIDLRQFLPLRVGVYLNMSVHIYRGVVKSGTAWIDVNSQTKNLTAHIPSTSGNAAYVLITIDTSGAVVATKGIETTIELLSLTDIPSIPANTLVELAAVRVYAGQTSVQEARSNTDIKDLRLPYYLSGALGGGAPVDAQYLTLSANGTLTDERILTAGVGISITDGGAGAAATISSNLRLLHEHVYQEDHSGEANGTKTQIITAQEYQPQNVNVYLNGLLQRYGVDFTEDTTYDAITFTTAPATGDAILLEYITA